MIINDYNLERWLVYGTLGFVLGIWIAGEGQWLLFPLVLVLLCVYGWRRKQAWQRILLLFVLTFGIGFGTIQLALLPQQELACVAESAKVSVVIEGEIMQAKEGDYYFLLRPQRVDGKPMTYDTVVAVLPAYQDETKYQRGQRIQLRGIFKEPMDQTNPGGFDERNYWRAQGVFYQLKAEEAALVVQPSHGLARLANELQQQVRHQLTNYLSATQQQIVLALLFGEKAGLDADLYSLAQKMGIAHIFAVSGLHVGFLIAFLLGILRLLRLEGSCLAVLLMAGLIGFYCLLVDFTPSAVRAAVMGVLTLVAQRFFRFRDRFTVLAAAALVVLWLQPFALWAVGFQLSFGVTLSLLYFYPLCQRWCTALPVWLQNGSAVALAAQLGSIPLTAWYFYYLSGYSLLLNLVLVPLIGLVVPLLLIAYALAVLLPWFAGFFFTLCSLGLAVVEVTLRLVADLLGTGQYYIGQPSLLAIGVYLLCLIGLRQQWWQQLCERWLRSPGKKVSVVVLMGLLLLLLWLPQRPAVPTLTYLDVGQGSSAVLIMNNGQAVVFDGGAKASVVASYLAYCGVNQVEAIVASHGDQDHVAGLERVLRDFSVRYFLTEAGQMQREELLPLLTRARQRGTQVVPVQKSARLDLADGLQLTVQAYDDGSTGSNAKELAALLQSGTQLAAFPGDLAGAALVQFVQSHPQITLWAVPHHGSRNSCPPGFYAGFRPVLAVISAGRDNGYGHPHREVLAQLTEQRIGFVRIDEVGAVSILLTEEINWQGYHNV